MALPTILVNATGGSDTQASGAGPATALFGTTDASTDGAGTTVTLTAGTDLTGVAVDGSHCIYLADATAGARNFGKITGSAGSGGATPTVTVANAFGLSLSGKSWAIGGKRASVTGTNSLKLFDNNGAAGDGMPGWIVEMQSGHTETSGVVINARRAGDTTSGPITLRGESGAATPPIITFSINASCIIPRADYMLFKDFEVRNSNATKTASAAFVLTVGNHITVDGVKISHSSDKFWKGVVWGDSVGKHSIINCEVGFTASNGLQSQNDAMEVRIVNNYIHDCGGAGIDIAVSTVNQLGTLIAFNVIEGCTGDGIIDRNSSTTVSRGANIIGNTIDSCGGDGIEITAVVGSLSRWLIVNNILSNNGGYGLNYSNASMTDTFISALGICVFNNQTYNNTSGAYKSSTAGYAFNTCPWASGDTGADPTFTNAAGGDFSIGTNLKAKGYPLGGTLAVGKTSATYSYIDPGAAQRQETGGGGGLVSPIITTDGGLIIRGVA